MQKNRKTRDQKRNTAATRAASRTVERRIERERARQRQRLIVTALVIAAVAVIVAIPLIIARLPSEAPIPGESAARYDGITMSRTSEGYPRLGDPDAPVQVAEYSSFGCTACKAFHDRAIDPIIERVRSGNISFVYVPLWQQGGITNAEGAARAAVCAAEQNKFWELHDAFFEWQSLYGNQAFTEPRIVSGVNALNMDRGEYDACVRSGRAVDTLTRAQRQANALINFRGTPTITINGVVPVDSSGAPLTDPDAILEAIDNAIAAAEARQQPAPITESTPDITEEPVVEETAEATEAAE